MLQTILVVTILLKGISFFTFILYSFLRYLTGLFNAAFIVWILIVKNDIENVRAPENKIALIPISTL